jgi:hypothetical protein
MVALIACSLPNGFAIGLLVGIGVYRFKRFLMPAH